jgi:hypothetical protein
MKFRVQLVIESNDDRPGVVEEIGVFERGQLGAENLGLTLAEARELLRGLQQAVVTAQTAQFSDEQTHCPTCGVRRARKGQHPIAFRTAFGKLSLPSPRYYQCCGTPTSAKSVSPLANLLAERTAPELVYLESKFAGLMSYGLTVSVLSEVLPLGAAISTTGVRRHVHAVAQRLEGELGEERGSFIDTCQLDLDKLPEPGPPLTVGLDGGFVHARDEKRRQAGSFEVIVGKSVVEDGGAKCFAFVNREDAKPKRRLFEVLKAQGLQANQQLMFLSDGGDTVRDLQMYLSPESEHWLDWFHITMRLTVMGQYVKALETELASVKPKPVHPGDDEELEGEIDAADVAQRLERLKWNLWHGNVRRALQIIDLLDEDLETDGSRFENGRKLHKAIAEFGHYIAVNRAFIPNYGDRYRHGEAISTAFVESAVNQVVSKRMVKHQQMRWTQQGAHRLLQIRTQALNGDLRGTFCRWYPGLECGSGIHNAKTAAA